MALCLTLSTEPAQAREQLLKNVLGQGGWSTRFLVLTPEYVPLTLPLAPALTLPLTPPLTLPLILTVTVTLSLPRPHARVPRRLQPGP